MWLSVDGLGCKENSADVVRFIEPQISAGKSRVVIDLQDCCGLDSTFMGMLIGVAKRLKKVHQGCLHIINAHGRNAQLLRGLGVQYFCNLTEGAGAFDGATTRGGCQCASPEEGVDCGDTVEDCEEITHHQLSKLEQTQHCLQAHITLCEVGSENQSKFHEVVDLMGQKLVQLQH